MAGQCADASGITEAAVAIGHLQGDGVEHRHGVAIEAQLVDGERELGVVEELFAGTIRGCVGNIVGLGAAIGDRVEDVGFAAVQHFALVPPET